MSLAKFSSDFLMESFTLVDNLFIHEYLPVYDEARIKVYLYGLYMCSAPADDNGMEKLSAVLDMDSSEIIAAFKSFEDDGLVKVVSEYPLEVKYLSLKKANQPPKKYKSEKWSDFNVQLQQLFPERQLTPNEYNEYYQFFDAHKIEQDAMLMIVQYCINLKGANVRYPYILTVAASWVRDGVKTVSDVEDRLNEYDAQTEEMRAVLKALNRKGGAELDEKQLLMKWTRSWGFDVDAVVQAAKSLKGGKNFKTLDKALDEYYRMSIFTAQEIKEYRMRREELKDLAVKINKTMGLYYESLEHVIEVYTQPWLNKGFDEEALLSLAHHCFVSGIRSLDGLNGVINKFFERGAVSLDAINEFIGTQLKYDNRIKEIIDATGSRRKVTASDREFYRTWSAVWGFEDDVIKYAAELAFGKSYPLSYVNKLLSEWRNKGIKSAEDAKRAGIDTPSAAKTQSVAGDFMQHNYTKEEVQSVITSIDQLENLDI